MLLRLLALLTALLLHVLCHRSLCALLLLPTRCLLRSLLRASALSSARHRSSPASAADLLHEPYACLPNLILRLYVCCTSLLRCFELLPQLG